MDNVRILPRTTVFGAFDHGCYGALERVNEHEANGGVRQIFWHVRSQRCILAGGVTERPIAFSNNDRPGIMLAAAVRTYVNRYGVFPESALLFSPIMMMAGQPPKICMRQGLKSQR